MQDQLQNDIFDSVGDMNVSMNDLSSNLPDFSLDGLEPVLNSSCSQDCQESGDQIRSPNVIVESIVPEEELGALLLSAPWEDLQPDLLDSLLDSYLK